MKRKLSSIKNKVILITGGTGSFGHSVLRRLVRLGIKEVRIFSRDEKKQHDMRLAQNDPRVKFIIGDVRDYRSVHEALHGVQYVFHAAALKQVPSCEFFPIEATQTNVIGTHNVLRAASELKVEKVVCLSTDKAAYPINAMGITKALMERVAVAESRRLGNNGTTICITRYGNVMASRGSVIPLFKSQILNKKPLTITNAGMTRFLMSLEEAVDLVLFAFEHGRQGELFVQKSPASTVLTLAQAMLKYYNSQSPIEVIGARHGEKLHETLLTSEEYSRAQVLKSYFRVSQDMRELNYSKYLEEGTLKNNQAQEYTSQNTEQLTVEQVVAKLREIELNENH